MKRTMTALALIAALSIPTLTACGSAVEGAVEQAAENAIGGNVDISSDGLSVTDSNGNEIQVGENVTLPGNWPAEVPTVDGGKLATVMVAGDGASVNAMWTTTLSIADAAAAYVAALEGAGYTQESTGGADNAQTGTYNGNGYTVTYVVSGEEGSATVLVSGEKSG